MGNASSIGREIRSDISKTIGRAMILLTEDLRNATPVDTTNAASNWIPTTGAAFEGVDGSREEPSHAAQDAGIEKLRSYDVVRDGKVFIKNNVLYLQYLDAGWSQHAPPGFVAMVFNGAAQRATGTRGAAVKKMIRGMARHAFLKGV